MVAANGFTDETRALQPLRRHFVIRDEPGRWALTCRTCCRSWTLLHGGEKANGNVLYLLNHALGHEEDGTL